MFAAEPLLLAGCGSVNGVPPPLCLRQPASRAAHATNATRIKPRRLALFITCLSKKEPCRPRAARRRLRTRATSDARDSGVRVQPLYRPRIEFLLRIFNN